MNLVQNIASLAQAIATEIKQRLTPEHASVAKAWVCFGVVRSQLVIRAAYNVANVLRMATGKYRVVFATPLPDANYAWFAFARNAGDASSMKFAAARVSAEAKTAEYVEVICTTASGTLSDSTELNLVVFR